MAPAYSVLDLAPVREGGTVTEAFRNSADLAQHAEQWGYTRYWLAEHHNMIGIASAATSVLIGHVAGATKTIRVGSGGIMLPNHAPLMVAEQFGTLEALYPRRIDLGLGRAPGTDPLTARALRRDPRVAAEEFPQQVEELLGYLGSENSGSVRAFPGIGSNVPVWLLGSSTYSAQLAASMGLPFAFAAHFAPADLMQAIAVYRERFQPSQRLDKPYVMVCIAAVAAETDAEAGLLATTLAMRFLQLVRGEPLLLRSPVDQPTWTPHEQSLIESRFTEAIIGSAATVKSKLQNFIERTGAQEVMINTELYDHSARLRSFELIAEAVRSTASATLPS